METIYWIIIAVIILIVCCIAVYIMVKSNDEKKDIKKTTKDIIKEEIKKTDIIDDIEGSDESNSGRKNYIDIEDFVEYKRYMEERVAKLEGENKKLKDMSVALYKKINHDGN